MSECGTPGGAQAHRKLGEKPCTECREAAAEYMRAYRALNPHTIRQQTRKNKVRQRALVRLAEEHPTEFRALLAEEKAKERAR